MGVLREPSRFSAKPGGQALRHRAAASLTTLSCIPIWFPPIVVFEHLLEMFKNNSESSDGPNALATFTAMIPNAAVHEQALNWATQVAARVAARKTTAQEKIDAVLDLTEFLTLIDQNEAKALFGRAHDMTEELDVDAVFQLKCLASLASRGTKTMSIDDLVHCNRFCVHRNGRCPSAVQPRPLSLDKGVRSFDGIRSASRTSLNRAVGRYGRHNSRFMPSWGASKGHRRRITVRR